MTNFLGNIRWSCPKSVQKKDKIMLTPASRFEILRPHTEIHNTSHMRTKTLLLTAALAAAGAASAMAQNVYSVNAVGYVNKSVVHGYSIVANPFVVANESLDALMPVPN